MSFFGAFEDSLSAKNNSSPFGEAGLLGDPLHYLLGSKYDKFMRKTWEYPNKYIGKYITKFDKFDRKINPLHKAIDKTSFGKKAADYAHNKPGDSALAVLGSIFGGGALMSGMGGGSTGGGLGVFSNGGTGGMGSVGTGNAGTLFANTGINTGGVGGVGTTGASAPGMGSMMGQGMPQMPGQQKQQKNTWLEEELERQEKERKLRAMIADQLGPQYV